MSSAEKPTSRKQRQAANRSLQGLHWQLEAGRGQRHLPEALGLTSIEDQACEGEMEEKCVDMSSFDSKNKSCNMHTPLAPLVFKVIPQFFDPFKTLTIPSPRCGSILRWDVGARVSYKTSTGERKKHQTWDFPGSLLVKLKLILLKLILSRLLLCMCARIYI